MGKIEVSSQEKSKDDNKIVKIAKSIKKLARDDPRRVTHSFKVGLALTLVSLLYYWRPLYDGFGISGIWAVLTVVVIFEFTVGATLSKGLNRGFATLLAGALGVGAQHLSSLFGKKGEPFVIGILVFILAAGSTYSRFYPKIKARYDYGVVIFILTFSLISVSGYRVDEQLLKMAHQRLSTILIGGVTCIFISIFVCPVWAGQELHNFIASNIEKLANCLQGFGGQYFQISEDGETAIVSKIDMPCIHSYKSVLNSKVTEETLANFASWEPRHGRFKFQHPWKQYLKIGTLVRQCGYQIEVLNSHVNSNIQVSSEFLKVIEASCTKMSNETAKALKAIALSIKTMRHESISINEHLEESNKAIKDLKLALEVANLENTQLLEIVPAVTVASILIEIVKCVENISEAVNELSQKAGFKKAEANVSLEVIKTQLLHKGTIQPVFDGKDDNAHHVIITVTERSDSRDHQNENSHHPPKP